VAGRAFDRTVVALPPGGEALRAAGAKRQPVIDVRLGADTRHLAAERRQPARLSVHVRRRLSIAPMYKVARAAQHWSRSGPIRPDLAVIDHGNVGADMLGEPKIVCVSSIARLIS